MPRVRVVHEYPDTSTPLPVVPGGDESADQPDPNTNPFVTHLQTLYSQSVRSNRGTRGLDPAETRVYVETALDRTLVPNVLAGHHSLVVITGNAGDGKTAFLENLLDAAVKRGAQERARRTNGADFVLNGREFHTNYDGSQDEEDTRNDEVLAAYLAPYTGPDPAAWSTGQTRLIAINEGRLIDFLTEHAEDYPALLDLVRVGLRGATPQHGVAVVNLNARSVVAEPDELDGSIFTRVLSDLTAERFWSACDSCDLVSRCYARHNAATFAHPAAGPRIAERLRTLYELMHVRGRLHMTLRDLRSALAFTLTSGRDCAQIHKLYEEGDAQRILDSYYFNAWAGDATTQDRLLTELRDIDVGEIAEPALDRRLDFMGPADGAALIDVDQRGDYDRQLLWALFRKLPRGSELSEEHTRPHRSYLAAARRHYFFECQDESRWPRMLPYQSAPRFLELLGKSALLGDAMREIVYAINRGEGLSDPARLGDALGLQVRDVPGGTVRSYRVFPMEHLTLNAVDEAEGSPYVESAPSRLELRYHGADGQQPTLSIGLDLFELLHRLRRGHLPGAADLQGRHLNLTVFTNTLAAAPYQEILLTVTGRDLHRVTRTPDGRLSMRGPSGDAPAPPEVDNDTG